MNEDGGADRPGNRGESGTAVCPIAIAATPRGTLRLSSKVFLTLYDCEQERTGNVVTIYLRGHYRRLARAISRRIEIEASQYLYDCGHCGR